MNKQDLQSKLNQGTVFYGTAIQILGWSDYLKFDDNLFYVVDMNTHKIRLDPDQHVYFYKSPVNSEFVQIVYSKQVKNHAIILFHHYDLDEMVDFETNHLEVAYTMSLDTLPHIETYIDGHDETRQVKGVKTS